MPVTVFNCLNACDCYRLCATVSDCLRLCATVRDCVQLSETVCDYLRMFATVRDCVRLFETVCDCVLVRDSQSFKISQPNSIDGIYMRRFSSAGAGCLTSIQKSAVIRLHNFKFNSHQIFHLTYGMWIQPFNHSAIYSRSSQQNVPPLIQVTT